MHHAATDVEQRDWQLPCFVGGEFVTSRVTFDNIDPLSQATQIDIPRGAVNFRIFADLAQARAAECFEMSTPDGPQRLELRRAQGPRAWSRSSRHGTCRFCS